jgi:hypothetical protein
MNPLASGLLALGLAVSAAAQGPTCTSSLAGLGCGASLAVSFTDLGGAGNHKLSLDATGLFPNAQGMMVWGVTPIYVPITTGCPMLVDFLWGHMIQTDAFGNWSWDRSWPASVVGFYYIQFGTFRFNAAGTFELCVSDCKRAECQ